MKYWLAVLPLLAGCTATSSAIKAKDTTTLPSGWRVDCYSDQHKAETTCFAGTFDRGGGAPFQVVYVNGKGPLISTPTDFPGRTATVRVDSGKVLSADDPKAVVEALNAGQVAYVVYHRWPSGEAKMTVDIAGFAEAYQVLLSKI